MPKGPLGGPRPLATGSITIRIIVEETTQNENALPRPEIVKTGLKNRGVTIEDVSFDSRVNTYMFNTGLDIIEWKNLERLKDEYKKSIKHHNMNQIGEVQVGFQ